MKRLLLAAAISLTALTSVQAQEVAPGWRATGHWQCGPVKIITSTDGFGALDMFVVGAWFDNHYTLRRGQLYYNGAPCIAVGQPFGIGRGVPERRRVSTAAEDCSIHLQDREVAETPEQQAAYDQCLRRSRK
jgi:hypothetical protein